MLGLFYATGCDTFATFADAYHHTLEGFARATLNKLRGTSVCHSGDFLRPAYAAGELAQEIGFDFLWVGMGGTIDILIDGARGCMELCGCNSLGEFLLGRHHKGRMEGSADGKHESALGTGFFESLTGCVNGILMARNNKLAGAVVVGGDDNGIRGAYFGTYSLYLFRGKHFGESDDGSHGSWLRLAGFLHGGGTLGHKAQTVLEGETAGHDEGGELTERVASHHRGLHGILTPAKTEGGDDAVEEHCGLGDGGLAKLLVSAVEHNVGNIEAEYFVGFLKKLTGYGMLLIEVVAHSYELGALSGEDICCQFV